MMLNGIMLASSQDLHFASGVIWQRRKGKSFSRRSLPGLPWQHRRLVTPSHVFSMQSEVQAVVPERSKPASKSRWVCA